MFHLRCSIVVKIHIRRGMKLVINLPIKERPDCRSYICMCVCVYYDLELGDLPEVYGNVLMRSFGRG